DAGRQQVLAVKGSGGAGALGGGVGPQPAKNRDIGVLLDTERPAGGLVAVVGRIGAERIGIGQHPVIGAYVGIDDVNTGPAWQGADRGLRTSLPHDLGLVAVVEW